MVIADLLVAAGIVTPDAVEAALKRQAICGGSLPDMLIEIGAVKREQIERLVLSAPTPPLTIEETGLSESELITLLLKLIYVGGLETRSAFIEAIKLPFSITAELIDHAVKNQLLTALSSVGPSALADMRYGLSDKGRHWAAEALTQCRYAGPAPVTLQAFRDRITQQVISRETLNFAKIQAVLGDLSVPEDLIDQIGPAVKSGRATLLYGPPGNGKTSIALRIGRMFEDFVYIPHAVQIEGQIMRVFDPTLHEPVASTSARRSGPGRRLQVEHNDDRWVACHRPFVVTGGELTLEMLDLRYDSAANFYEAPLHVKATGGCLLIDDLGRQLVSPESLLNRWIAPLENRIDYLRMHNGATFSVPFETLVIFSTNLEPADLMDPAFLRRIPYKLPVHGPTPAEFRRIFQAVAAEHGLDAAESVVDYVVRQIEAGGSALAAYQPQFIIDQIVAACAFREEPLRLEKHLIDRALANLSVERNSPRVSNLAAAA